MAKAKKGTESQITRIKLGHYNCVIDPVAGTIDVGGYITITKDQVREIYDKLNALPAEEPAPNMDASKIARTENTDQEQQSIPNDLSSPTTDQTDSSNSGDKAPDQQAEEKEFGGFGGGESGGAGASQDYSDSQNQGDNTDTGADTSGSDSGNDSGSSDSDFSSDSGSSND